MATRRCWAPSCRLRSSRRRSASPAVDHASREACSSSTRDSSSACSRSRSRATLAAAHTTSSSSGWWPARRRGPARRCGRRRCRRGHRAPRALRRQRRRARPRIDVGLEPRQPIGEHERRVAERLGQRFAEPRRTRRALKRDDKVGHPGPRELLAQDARSGTPAGPTRARSPSSLARRMNSPDIDR